MRRQTEILVTLITGSKLVLQYNFQFQIGQARRKFQSSFQVIDYVQTEDSQGCGTKLLSRFSLTRWYCLLVGPSDTFSIMNGTSKNCFGLNVNMDKTEELFITNILVCVINSMFSLMTSAGNFIILYVIRKDQDFHSPSFILLACLALSDLLVGAICQPFSVAFKIFELVDNFPGYCTLRMLFDTSGWITAGVSFLTLAAVSVDRLLALTLHLRYQSVVTIRRVIQTSIAIWMFAILVTMLKFWMSYAEWIFLPFFILLLTFLVTAFSTSKIFQIVRRHQRQINNQNMAILRLETNTVNVLKCKKSTVTVLYVYGLFLIFYLPFCGTIIVEASIGYTTAVKVAYGYTSTAVFMNSFLNPILYCWRMREIRRAVKNILRRR